MAEVVWPPTATDQIDQIVAYIAQHDPVAAVMMRDRIYALGNSLVDFPHRGRPASGGHRELVTASPYVLRYAVDGARVTILGVRHGAQRDFQA